MRILFLTLYDEQWASSRIRVYQYLPILQQQGVECKVLPIITSNFSTYGRLRYYLSSGLSTVIKWLETIFLGRKYDAIFIDNVFLPLHMEKLIKAANENIIYSFSDAFYVGYDANYVARDPVRMFLSKFGKILQQTGDTRLV